MGRLKTFILHLLLLFGLCGRAFAKSDPARSEIVLNQSSTVAREQRPLLAHTKIKVKIECQSPEPLTVSWRITERECWIYSDAQSAKQAEQNSTFIQSPDIDIDCSEHNIYLPEWKPQSRNSQGEKAPNANVTVAKKLTHPLGLPTNPIYTTQEDDIYELEIMVKDDIEFTATITVEVIGPHGYISATDWPLLHFYGIMCIVYVIYGLIWLMVSFLQWRDLLRIQFWIGGVIFLGMLEKAFFYAQYQSLNHTGREVQGAELVAEFVSCAKRTLARMLVIIMSLGFGIVKPRLGPMLHRVVGVGLLYFVLACVESYLRIMRTKDVRNELLVASIPLAVLDTGICWWIFTSLVQTTRTLRLRRNMVKLSLYRHFTNTLIFSILASVIFMLYAMQLRKKENCTPYWKDIWVDNAFWHVLFSSLLLVIMILWRPTNNNQRYAFTPLLDNPEDEDDDEEDQYVADAYGVKMRQSHTNGGGKTPPLSAKTPNSTTEEDDLRWVEENIPSMGDPALPVLDSDEEIINTKFEVSKMQ